MKITLAAIAAALIGLPYVGMPAFYESFGYLLLSAIVLATSWNVLSGYTGLVSVGQQAYVGLGGYVLFGFAILLGLNPLLGIAAAGIIGAVAALPVARLIFRLNGAYFAIGTWVIAEVFRLSFANLSALGGGSGISLPVAAVKGIASSRDLREQLIYWIALALAAGSIAAVYLLLRSRTGLALTAIRDSEVASSSLGVRIGRTKLWVYVVVAGITAMVGALIFLQKLRISPDAAFSVNDWTAFVIFIVVIGGIGTIEGPIIGTLVYFLLREYLADLGTVYLLILGALAIIIMLVAPKGIWGLIAGRFGIQLFPVGTRVEWK